MKLPAVRLVEDPAATRSFYSDPRGDTLMHVKDPSANVVTFVQD